MSKELEVKDLQANFIKCFNELLTKTDKDIIVVNISREMAQDMVNLYEKYLTVKPSKASIDTATEMLLTELEMLSDCAIAMEEEPSSNWIEYAETDAELDLKLHFAYLDIKQALIKSQEQEKINTRLLQNCERWFKLLGQEGINSKAKVRDEIEAVLEELKGEKYESL